MEDRCGVGWARSHPGSEFDSYRSGGQRHVDPHQLSPHDGRDNVICVVCCLDGLGAAPANSRVVARFPQYCGRRIRICGIDCGGQGGGGTHACLVEGQIAREQTGDGAADVAALHGSGHRAFGTRQEKPMPKRTLHFEAQKKLHIVVVALSTAGRFRGGGSRGTRPGRPR